MKYFQTAGLNIEPTYSTPFLELVLLTIRLLKNVALNPFSHGHNVKNLSHFDPKFKSFKSHSVYFLFLTTFQYVNPDVRKPLAQDSSDQSVAITGPGVPKQAETHLGQLRPHPGGGHREPAITDLGHVAPAKLSLTPAPVTRHVARAGANHLK